MVFSTPVLLVTLAQADYSQANTILAIAFKKEGHLPLFLCILGLGMDDYKKVIGQAAARKVIVLAKEFLEIIEELEVEEESKIEKFENAARKFDVNEQLDVLVPFLYLIDKKKKETLRKRILDKANSLVRELEE